VLNIYQETTSKQLERHIFTGNFILYPLLHDISLTVLWNDTFIVRLHG
jgi:hypothetical protein